MDPKTKLESIERDKERMIRQYMSLQDRADAVNEEIYKVCCSVEALNVQISALKEEIRLAELKGKGALARSSIPTNGAAHPPTNGTSHPH
jgi:hypothetical protein